VQADRFTLTRPAGPSVGFFETRTYTVPGDKVPIDLRATTAGTDLSSSVLAFGRAN
jgi:hypothetical protein